MIGNYSVMPRLLPTSRNSEIDQVPKTIPRVPGGDEGHYTQWINACLKGYGKAHLDSPYSYAGPMTEAVLMGNLAIRSYQYNEPGTNKYPGRKKLLWDAKNMKITNFDVANEFVKREYRDGWSL